MGLYPGFEQELSKVNLILEPEHELNPSGRQGDFCLSSLLVLAARFNGYDSDKVCSVAAAVELLDMAVDLHYGESCKLRLSLITGDYFYAKALSLVAPIGDQQIIFLASEAISDVARSEEKLSDRRLDRVGGDLLEQRAALYRLACHLGARLGGVGDERIRLLKEIGTKIGADRAERELSARGVRVERGGGVAEKCDSTIAALRPKEAASDLQKFIEMVSDEKKSWPGSSVWT